MFGGAGRFDDEPGGFGAASSAGGNPHDATKDVSNVSSQVTRFRQLVGKIGSPSDSRNLREEISRTQSTFTQLVRVGKEKLQPQIKSTDSSVKVQADRLWQQLQQSVGSFEDVLRELRSKEQRYPASAIGGASGPRYASDSFGFAETDMPAQGHGSGGARGAQAQELSTLNLEKREQDHAQLMNLERDMQDLHEMFVDMATMVNDQGEVVNSIESNVESAQIRTEQAVTHTAKAADYQSRARKKKICVAVLLIIILIIIVVVVAVVASQ